MTTNNRLPAWLMRMLNVVPADAAVSRIEAAKRDAEKARLETAREVGRRESVEQQLRASNASRDAAAHALKVLRWTPPQLMDFMMPTRVPLEFIERTLASRHQFAPLAPPGTLGDVSAFRGNPDVAGLYWAIAHASRDANEEVGRMQREDAVTSAFADGLKREVETARSLLGSNLAIAIGKFYDHRVPLVRELSVGADLLAVISGRGLVPNGGVRLVWIQFKLADRETPMVLNVKSRINSNGTQFDALRAVDVPEKGSIGLYALASLQFEFYSAKRAGEIVTVNPRDASTCKVDLAMSGVRLQELLLEIATSAEVGQFDSGRAVIDFVDRAAAQRSIIPLAVVGISSDSELEPNLGASIVRQARAKWEKRLDEYRWQLDPKLAQELDRRRSGSER